jgi:hypothetical protein
MPGVGEIIAELGPHTGIGWMEWTDSGLAAETGYCYKIRVSKFDGFLWSTSSTPNVCGETEVSPPSPISPADLAVNGSAWVEPSFFPDPFETFTVYWYICNFGGTETGSFTDVNELNGGVETYTISHGFVSPGECYVDWVYYAGGLPEGDHYWYIYVDAYNDVTESNEANNINYLGIGID